MIIISQGRLTKETQVREVLLYWADKIVDFLLAIIIVIVSYYITKWLDRKSK